MSDGMKIVGIGASAGGIEALRGFLQSMPPTSGIGFVIVLHLSPDRPSMLADVLGHWTAMPVLVASDGASVQPNQCLVNPPASVLTMEQGRVRVSTPHAASGREPSLIDTFFSSLAADQGGDAIGIVLSGTGSDGALGLKAIKESGGISFAQGRDGTQPQFGDMPAAAIATGSVDLIVPVEAMPGRILQLVTQPGEAAQELTESEQFNAVKSEIAAILRSQIGHDFSGFKEPTFMRRVHRRVQLLGLDMQGYVAQLRSNSEEVALLFRDLLIGVTSFFRDAEVFDAIQQTVIPALFHDKTLNSTVRVWVPGCSTGEEAYSWAILLRQYVVQMSAPPQVQVFATDIDEAAIAVARLGRYPEQLMKNVPVPLRARYFSGGDGTFVVNKDVREICTFSVHSLIRDPPFSRIDLISCRNVLIYLDPELQSRVIPAFHYSLVHDGILLLGGSEAVTRHAELFAALDKKHRIFRRRDSTAPLLPLGAAVSGRLPKLSKTGAWERPRTREQLAGVANKLILERFAPAFVVVDADLEVQQFSSRTGKYFEAPPGTPSNNVVALARRGLKARLRSALREAAATGAGSESDGIAIEIENVVQLLRLTVEPLPSGGPDRLFLVVFTDQGPAHPGEGGPSPHGASAAADEATLDQLERELRDAREQVQSTAEDYEAALEELKSANEELHSVNEELQSTNEELETSKEEIQSMNEELQTVNAQLQSKLEELDRAHADLHNLFDSTQVATIFLDRDMIVRGFTPAASRIYNLIPSDQGRPLTDIVSQLDYHGLREDLQQLLAGQTSLERRVVRRDRSAHYLMRMLPYRAGDNSVSGTLITFVDVSSMVQAEEHHRLLVDELNHRVRNMLTVVTSLATQTLRRSVSLEAFSEVFTGRLHALAATYTLLARDKWTQVPIRDVMIEELRPYFNDDGSNIIMDGPLVLLRPKAALALGMTVHELATNAVKYGALSVPDGRVLLNWHQDSSQEPGQIIWRWREVDGPAVSAPPCIGFGVTMVRRSVGHDLNGDSSIDFQPQGVVATLRFPVDASNNTSATGNIRMRGAPP